MTAFISMQSFTREHNNIFPLYKKPCDWQRYGKFAVSDVEYVLLSLTGRGPKFMEFLRKSIDPLNYRR